MISPAQDDSIPMVNICIPLYNGSTYLSQCLDSILAQRYKEFKVIIIDDRSKDNSLEIAQRYQKKDTRIKIYQNQENLGLVQNWNKCILLSRAKWIKFVFQDDILLPDCLELFLAAEKHDCPLIVGKREFIFEEENDPHNHFYKDKIVQLNSLFKQHTYIDASEFSQYLYDYIIDNSKSMNLLGEPSNMLIRRDIAHQVGLFNPELIQSCDYEYWARIATNYGAYLVTDTVSKFRIHADSTTNKNKNNRSLEKQLDLLKVFYDFLFHPVYASFRNSISKRKKQKLYQYTLKYLNKIKDQLSGEEQKIFDMFLKAYPIFQSYVYQSKVDYTIKKFSSYVHRKFI
jgi:glycosyltransferase involved in cell wall biosynthesis